MQFLHDVKSWFRDRVAIDPRILGVFRISIAVILLTDLTIRLTSLTAHYTDYGVLPLSVWNTFYGYLWPFTFHAVSGSPLIQTALFLLAAVFAVMLLVGYRTRTAAIASWLLLVSLHARNPLILNGGDELLRLLLFWSIFLPLNATYSIDNTSTEKTGAVTSIGTAAILLQIVLTHVGTTALKLQYNAWWPDLTAVYYTLSLDRFTTALGETIPAATVTTPLTAFILLAWLSTPFLLLTTGKWRARLTTALILTHLGLAATLHLGIFPFLSIAGLLLFFPSATVDRVLQHHWGRRIHTALSSFPRRIPLPEIPSPVSTVKQHLHRWFTPERRYLQKRLSVFTKSIVVAALIYVFLWNAAAINIQPAEQVTQETPHIYPLGQEWRMFTNPTKTDGWYVIPGTLRNGSQVNLFTTPVTGEKPGNVAATYRNQRWRKYLSFLLEKDNEEFRQYYAEYLCRRWNTQHGNTLSNITLIFMEETTQPPDQATTAPKPRVLLRHQCNYYYVP